MKHLKYAGLVIAAVVMVLALVTSCGPAAPETPPPAPEPIPEPPPPEELPPVKIGSLLAYTGAATGTGQLFNEGIELYLEEANYEVAGRDIEYIMEDSASEPDAAMDKARKLVEVDGVDVILGPLQSHCGAAVAAYLETVGVPNIALFEHEKDILANQTLIIPDGTLDGFEVGFGRYAAETLGFEKVSCIMPDYVAGHVLAESFFTGFEEKGGAIAEELYYPLPTMDFAPFLTNIGDADCVLTFFVSPPDVIRFVQQHAEFGIDAQILMIHCETAEAVFQPLGDMALGMIGASRYTWRIDTDINRRFVEAYMNKYEGRTPLAFSASGYRSTSVFLEAVEATGGDTTPETIINAIKGMTLDSPAGPVTITEARAGTPMVYIVECNKADGTYVWDVLDTYINVMPE